MYCIACKRSDIQNEEEPLRNGFRLSQRPSEWLFSGPLRHTVLPCWCSKWPPQIPKWSARERCVRPSLTYNIHAFTVRLGKQLMATQSREERATHTNSHTTHTTNSKDKKKLNFIYNTKQTERVRLSGQRMRRNKRQ